MHNTTFNNTTSQLCVTLPKYIHIDIFYIMNFITVIMHNTTIPSSTEVDIYKNVDTKSTHCDPHFGDKCLGAAAVWLPKK